MNKQSMRSQKSIRYSKAHSKSLKSHTRRRKTKSTKRSRSNASWKKGIKKFIRTRTKNWRRRSGL